MKTIRTFIFILFGIIGLSGCLKDETLKIGLNITPVELDDGWEISTPSEEGFDSFQLRQVYVRFFSEDEYITGISLIIVRNQKLIMEGYCRDIVDREVKRSIQSVTKSISSLVFGITYDQGFFDDLNQRLFDIVPEYFDSDLDKREITLRHLMTMRSGLEFDNDAFAQELHVEQKKNQMRYILSKDLFALPGKEFWYRDCDPQLIGGAILAQTGMLLEEIAGKYLFGPMGIEEYVWEKNVDGHNWAAHALFMRPRDMAKIGQLVLNQGKWNGQQLVSMEWLSQSTAIQYNFSNSGYGYYWWIYPPNYSHLPNIHAIAAEGAGGQIIFIVPDKELVIVMTSESFTEADFSLEFEFFYLAEMIVNAMKD